MLHAIYGVLLGLFPAFAPQAVPEKSPGVWLDVPYVKQTEDGCGSAVISMLLQYWSMHGTRVEAERADASTIQKQLYSPKARGIFGLDMERYLRDSGFREFALHGTWGELRQHLEKGRPLILSIQPGSAKVPFHYVVITGMDWEHEALFVNDPARGKLLRIERQEFEKEWQAARNWMLLAVPAASN
jgi:ABC-type bacteriocin/lantibiotic exporter with double-glycine peptidase domain